MIPISFRLKNPKAKRTTAILVDISCGNRRIKRSIGHSIAPEAWNIRRQRVIESRPEAPGINLLLERICMEVWGAESDARLKEEKFSLSDVDSALGTVLLQNEDVGDELRPASEKVGDVMLEWIEANQGLRRDGTLRVWRTLRNHVSRLPPDLASKPVSKIDYDWIAGFISDLRQRGTCDSAIWKYVRAWKVFMKWCQKLEYYEGDVHKRVGQGDFHIRRSHAVRLTKSQLERLYRVDLSDSPGAHNARQLFVLQSCLGVRYSDLIRIVTNPDAFIEDGMIRLRTEKTDVPVVIPLLPLAKEILACDPPRNQSNQKYNLRLKVAAERAGLTDPVIRVKWYGGKSVEEHTRLCDLLSSHAAKRTFVTLMATVGVRTETIMKVTGNSRSTIDAYIHLNENEISDELLEKGRRLFGD